MMTLARATSERVRSDFPTVSSFAVAPYTAKLINLLGELLASFCHVEGSPEDHSHRLIDDVELIYIISKSSGAIAVDMIYLYPCCKVHCECRA